MGNSVKAKQKVTRKKKKMEPYEINMERAKDNDVAGKIAAKCNRFEHGVLLKKYGDKDVLERALHDRAEALQCTRTQVIRIMHDEYVAELIEVSFNIGNLVDKEDQRQALEH